MNRGRLELCAGCFSFVVQVDARRRRLEAASRAQARSCNLAAFSGSILDKGLIEKNSGLGAKCYSGAQSSRRQEPLEACSTVGDPGIWSEEGRSKVRQVQVLAWGLLAQERAGQL